MCPHGESRNAQSRELAPHIGARDLFVFLVMVSAAQCAQALDPGKAVMPRFYQSAWFMFLCTLLVTAVLYGLHHVSVVWRRAQTRVLQERQRIAGEIHDGLAQDLSGIGLQIEAALKIMHASPGLAEGHLHTAKSLVKTRLNQVRQSIGALSTPSPPGEAQ